MYWFPPLYGSFMNPRALLSSAALAFSSVPIIITIWLLVLQSRRRCRNGRPLPQQLPSCTGSSCGGSGGRRLPPSPPGLPLIGNLHQLGPLPHRSLSALARRHGPLMLLHLGRVPTLVVSSALAAREVTKTHDLVFASRPPSTAASRFSYGRKDVALAPYGEYWKQARRISIFHLLSSNRVRSFRGVREAEVAAMVEDVSSSNRPINLSEKLVGLTNAITSRIVLGKRYSGRDDTGQGFRELLGEFLALLGAFKVGDFIPTLAWVDKLSGFDARLEQMFRQVDGFLERVVEEHLRRRGATRAAAGENNINDVVDDDNNSFVSALLSLHNNEDDASPDSSSLDRDSIKALILDMFAAGTYMVSTALEWAMAELVRHPRVMDKVQREVRGVHTGAQQQQLVGEDDLQQMSYLKAVVKEALRLHPPLALLVPRESLSSTRLQGGLEIPAKTRVLINAWAIGRDPVSWERAEEFWPERFAAGCGSFEDDDEVDFKGHHFQLIPFGAGRRGCPGIPFAVAIVELALANLLYHFDWRAPGGSRGEDLDMGEAPGLTTHRRSSLLLDALPRCV